MKKIIYILGLLAFALGVVGQDIHFSQFYRSPLTLNPALSGLSLGNHRGVINYRNQWSSVMSPFQTFAVSYDASIDPAKISEKLKGDFIGAGGYFVKDKAGEAGLNTTRFMATGAYHKVLGEDNPHYLAAGFQLGGVQEQINFNNLNFSSQWDRDNRGFNTNISSGEGLADQTELYFDLQMGVLWYYFAKGGANIFAGASLFHITKPKMSFLGQENRVNRRLVLHAGSRLPINEKLNIVPNFLVMKQTSAQEINLGASAEYVIDDMNRVALGSWYRVGDAVIISAMFEYNTYSIGLSYDVNVSELRTVSGGRGGFEISLILVYPPEKVLDFGEHPCPRL